MIGIPKDVVSSMGDLQKLQCFGVSPLQNTQFKGKKKISKNVQIKPYAFDSLNITYVNFYLYICTYMSNTSLSIFYMILQ